MAIVDELNDSNITQPDYSTCIILKTEVVWAWALRKDDKFVKHTGFLSKKRFKIMFNELRRKRKQIRHYLKESTWTQSFFEKLLNGNSNQRQSKSKQRTLNQRSQGKMMIVGSFEIV